MLINRTKEIVSVTKNEIGITIEEDDSSEVDTLTMVDELRQIRDPHQLHQKLQELPNNRIGKNFKIFFTQKLVQMQSIDPILVNDTAISALDIVSNRHNDLVTLNTSIIELQKLFVDMAILVREQDSLFNNIEANVLRACAFVEKGKDDMKTAVVHQKKSRKK